MSWKKQKRYSVYPTYRKGHKDPGPDEKTLEAMKAAFFTNGGEIEKVWSAPVDPVGIVRIKGGPMNGLDDGCFWNRKGE